MAEDDNAGNGGQGTETETAAASKERPYGVFSEITIDLSADAEKIVEQIKECVAEGAKDATVLVRVGRANADAPRAALTSVGQLTDLDGDYQVIADNSRNTFDKVKSEVKRSVSIG